MNYIQSLGPLALASRLKNVSETFMRDMVRVYKELQLDFEPRWFALLHLIHHKGSMPITHIALELNQTHPAVNQVTNALESKGYIRSQPDEKDHRKRIVQLTTDGRLLVEHLTPVWNAVEQSVSDLLKNTAPELLQSLDALEDAVAQHPMNERIGSYLDQDGASGIRINEYRPEYRSAFRSLNEIWLQQHFTIEAEDARILENPEEEILAKGGFLFFALSGNTVAGTCALLRLDADTCELTKMAVDPVFQGRGIGRLLLKHTLKTAQEASFTNMILLTSEVLDKALALYRSEGFTRSKGGSVKQHTLERCSIQLEINLIHHQ